VGGKKKAKVAPPGGWVGKVEREKKNQRWSGRQSYRPRSKKKSNRPKFDQTKRTGCQGGKKHILQVSTRIDLLLRNSKQKGRRRLQAKGAIFKRLNMVRCGCMTMWNVKRGNKQQISPWGEIGRSSFVGSRNSQKRGNSKEKSFEKETGEKQKD